MHSNDQKNNFLGCLGLILLAHVNIFTLASISSESENDLEEDLSFTFCGHATIFNAKRKFPVNKVALLSFKS